MMFKQKLSSRYIGWVFFKKTNETYFVINSLDHYRGRQRTPVFGREYPSMNSCLQNLCYTDNQQNTPSQCLKIIEMIIDGKEQEEKR